MNKEKGKWSIISELVVVSQGFNTQEECIKEVMRRNKIKIEELVRLGLFE